MSLLKIHIGALDELAEILITMTRPLASAVIWQITACRRSLSVGSCRRLHKSRRLSSQEHFVHARLVCHRHLLELRAHLEVARLTLHLMAPLLIASAGPVYSATLAPP